MLCFKPKSIYSVHYDIQCSLNVKGIEMPLEKINQKETFKVEYIGTQRFYYQHPSLFEKVPDKLYFWYEGESTNKKNERIISFLESRVFDEAHPYEFEHLEKFYTEGEQGCVVNKIKCIFEKVVEKMTELGLSKNQIVRNMQQLIDEGLELGK